MDWIQLTERLRMFYDKTIVFSKSKEGLCLLGRELIILLRKRAEEESGSKCSCDIMFRNGLLEEVEKILQAIGKER